MVSAAARVHTAARRVSAGASVDSRRAWNDDMGGVEDSRRESTVEIASTLT